MNDEYKGDGDKVKPLAEGKTAEDLGADISGEEEFIPLSGKNKAVKAQTLSAVQKYVKLLAEQAAKQLKDGVIVPSPYSGTCEYCDFAAICGKKLSGRKVSGVDTEFIAESVKDAGGKEDDGR